ncbi:hypothetical protein E1294_44840 [Nonomuraea diastatica]|uniref:Uncharacterized protein n=2 Tax=Nonomuraea diastatica TaxID=1848329 RepID=A0A4V2YCI3_9ACTN|nr:hypothetical protein E1294_44840 [Nonomuraea diastatica]
MKQRWSAATVECGLVRDSAAWFVLPAQADRAELERTFAAAVFLALAPATRTTLATMTRQGAYSSFFASAAELMPALLFFWDEPTGREEWHRYLWPGPPAPGLTCPYTKVVRAGRGVPPGQGFSLLETAHTAVQRAESGVDADPSDTTAPAHLRRFAANASFHAGSSVANGDKLTRFCARLAADLYVTAWARIDAAAGHRRMADADGAP